MNAEESALPAGLLAAVAEVAAAERLLVGCDFDGVLAPFVLDPMDARPQAGTIEALRALAAAPATVAALVSGRDLATLTTLTGLDGEDVTLIGSHGAQSSRSTAPILDERARALLAATRAQVEAALAARAPRVRLEHKPAAVVLHTRGLDEVSAAAADEVAVEAAAVEGVGLLRGKGVLELTVVRADKGTALRALGRQVSADALVYLGDDVTDEHVFTVLGPGDLGVKVGPGASAARERLADLTLVPELLARLAAARG